MYMLQMCSNHRSNAHSSSLQVLAAVNGGLSPKDVDMVLLVGRATRMPGVRSLLVEYFGRGPGILSQAVRRGGQLEVAPWMYECTPH